MPQKTVRPGDVTGQIHKRLAAKAKSQQQAQWNDYQHRMQAAKDEMDNAKRIYPMAIQTWNEEEIIDYTGSFTGYDPDDNAVN